MTEFEFSPDFKLDLNIYSIKKSLMLLKQGQFRYQKNNYLTICIL